MVADYPDTPKAELATDSHLASKTINDSPTKGLIIDDLHVDKILDGTGTWEMRSGSANQPGLIALIKQDSGQIVALANLVALKGSVSYQDRLNNANQQRISEECLRSGNIDNWDVAWILENARRLINPIKYQHGNEGDVWVNLELHVQEELALAIA